MQKRLFPLALVALVLSLPFLLPTAGYGQACTHYGAPSAQGSGTGSSPGNAMTVGNFIGQSTGGQVLCLADGTYTGTGLEFFSTHQGSPGNPITIRAINDGGPFFDGGFGSNVLFFQDTSYITVIGVDGCCSPKYNNPINFVNSHHVTLQRVCVWHSDKPPGAGGDGSNQHVMGFGSHDLLIEDVCLFGYGRNTFILGGDETRNNVVSRLWMRWDGWEDGIGATCGGPAIQTQYGTPHTNDIYENVIALYWGGLHIPHSSCGGVSGGWVTRAGMLDTPATGGTTVGPSWLGVIIYGYPDYANLLGTGESVGMANRWGQMTIKDAFVDGRYGGSSNTNVNLYGCELADPNDPTNGPGQPGPCSQVHIHGVTSIINSGQPTGTLAPSGSDSGNLSQCTSLGACPNFYNGSGGSQACFEYQNGSLSSTPLWPWRMDDRIKQALQRSGIGQGLQGSAGTGYAANTVTSEIVSRYGAVPSSCLRGGGAPVPAITSPLTATGAIGTAFSYQITATNSPTSYNASGLPPGLSVNTSTGLISGTPTSGGTSSISISATNANGTGSATLTLSVSSGPAVAWWKFDDNGGTLATDATGNGHTITMNGGAGWGGPKVGVAAMRCNGAAASPDTADVVFDNPQYTWMGWLRSDTAPSTTLFQAPLANGPTNAGTDAWGLWWSSQDAAGTTVQTIFHRDSGGIHQFKIPVALAANTWYHLAVTYDGTTVQAYLNGQAQGSFAAGRPVIPSGPFQVCGRYFPTPWAGDLDEWQITDHALTGAQILTEYQRGATANRWRAHKVLAQ